MTAEIDRRTLLKGFMFTAGLVAVGIDIPLAIVAPAPETSAEDFAPEHGDIWIHSAGRNHFIGKSISIRPGAPDIIDMSVFMSPHPIYEIGMKNPETDVVFYADAAGIEKVYEHFINSDTCDIAFGLRPGYVYSKGCFIKEAETYDNGDRFLKGSFVFVASKPFVFTRQA